MKLGNLSRLNAGSDHFHFLGKGTTYSGPIYGILLICEFQNGGPKMASKIVNVKGLPWKLVFGGFWMSLLRIYVRNLEIQDGGFKMAYNIFPLSTNLNEN